MIRSEWSLFRRLVAGFCAAFFALTLFSNLFLYFLLVRDFQAQRSAILNDRLDAISVLVKSRDWGAVHRRIETEWPKRSGEKVFVEVLDPAQKPVSQTPDLPPGLYDSEGKSFLIRSRTADDYQIRAAIGDEQERQILGHYRTILFVVLGIGVFFSIILGWLVARRGMRPLSQMAEKIRRIGSRTLHERLEVSDLPVELHSMAQSFNHSLDQLEDSFGRLSRFSADIAHELRTPVSNITAELEVALTRSRSEEDYREVLSSTLEECSRLTQMIESLLFLARAEDLKHGLKLEALELREEVEGMIEFYEPSASEKGISISLSMPDRLQIRAERVLFQRALGNLIANAIRYTPDGGKVEVLCESAGSFIEIRVRDNGPGIPEPHLNHIFERFYRVDPSRTPHSGGFGLGLAIVKSATELHGGQVVARSSADGTEMLLRWPRA